LDSLAASLFTPSPRHLLARAAAASGWALILQQAVKMIWLHRSATFELRASGELLRHRHFVLFALRICGLAAIVVALIVSAANPWIRAICLLASIGMELLGRYLFFVIVVPKSMAAPYLRETHAA
jgi:formate dehydrogenase iron-sulfur subunit